MRFTRGLLEQAPRHFIRISIAHEYAGVFSLARTPVVRALTEEVYVVREEVVALALD